MAPPPGGPPDRTPPRLIATLPESVTVLEGFDGWVEFTFDEVISEGGQPNFGLGTGDLERLVLLSPGTEVPRVDWRRNTVKVRWRDAMTRESGGGALCESNATSRCGMRSKSGMTAFDPPSSSGCCGNGASHSCARIPSNGRC